MAAPNVKTSDDEGATGAGFGAAAVVVAGFAPNKNGACLLELVEDEKALPKAGVAAAVGAAAGAGVGLLLKFELPKVDAEVPKTPKPEVGAGAGF